MTDDELEGRAARLKAAFPGAYHQDGAFVSFDMDAIRKAIGWNKPVHTHSGLSFQRTRDHIWVSLETKVGNVVSAWSWRVTDAEWGQIVRGMTTATPAEQEREALRLEALALHERYLAGELGPAEYERLLADLGKQPDDLTRAET